MAERKDPQQQYLFKELQLFKNDPLGTGSYGAVCTAKCDQLLCAAKLIYPVFFQNKQMPDLGKEDGHSLRRFHEECQFFSRINHPNIVQYLGTYRDPEKNNPVLLMELMDESLTHFLESSPRDLPYHTQVKLSYDIAQALTFLHSNGIIHRDLSSNNVLLLASTRAKVSDFGMSKLIDLNAIQQATLTNVPGKQNYMSPETFKEPPVYTKKLDNFSFGVLLVQIITRQFPTPKNRFKTQQLVDPAFPEQKISANVPVPELERRQAHIDLIGPDHPLLPTALHCLKDSHSERPTATQLCQTLTDLKRTARYQESSQKDLHQQLTEKDQEVFEKSTTIDEKDKQLFENSRQLQEKDQQLDENIKELKVCNETIKSNIAELLAKEEKISSLEANCSVQQQTIQKLDRKVKELRQVLAGNEQLHENERQAPTMELATIRNWGPLPNVPAASMKHGSSAAIGDQVYFKSHDDKVVYTYSNLTYQWNKLSPCPKSFRSIVNVDYTVTAVGSEGQQISSGKVYNYDQGKWGECFNPMPNKRNNPAVLYANNTLVVAGGHVGKVLSASVNILNTVTKKWSSVSSLPVGMTHPSATICGGDMYIHPRNNDQEKNSVYKCSLDQLVQSQPNSNIWQKITMLPVSCSSLVTVNSHLLAVGGEEANYQPTANIYEYINKLWQIIGKMTSPRSAPLTAVLPGNKLMVVDASAKCELADII